MKILVIGPSWVGDMMMSQSLYRTLKAEYPSAEIAVMAPAWCRPLLARMPEVSQALELPFGHGELALGARRRSGIALRASHYDRAYVLPNSFKSALVPFFAHIPQRIGWRGEMRYGLLNDARTLDKAAFPLMVQRYVALAYPAQQIRQASDLPQPLLRPQLQVSAEEIATTLAALQLNNTRPRIGFCPGAEFGPAKRWPHYHYAALAQMLIAQGYQVVLLGSAKDHPVGEQIRQLLNENLNEKLLNSKSSSEKSLNTKPLNESSAAHCINLAGQTHLEQAVSVIASCQAIVSNDSGLMHIAAALNRPLVALYGPSSPDFTPPLSDQAKVIRLISGYHKIRQGDAREGYHQSLIDIQPTRVFAELAPLLISDQRQ